MRLFLAIRPDKPFREALLDMQKSIREQGVRGNDTKPENLHLTLAFLGEYGDPDRVLDVAAAVPFSPFTLRLEGLGAFDRIFWAGLGESQELLSYDARLRRALALHDIPFDRKAFKPHITLIRQATLDKHGQLPHITVPRRTMRVRRICLMRSDRGKSGMIYTEIGAIEA